MADKYIERLNKAREELKSRFKERGNVIDGMFVALFAMQHVLLLGVPGTAKSMLTTFFAMTVMGEDDRKDNPGFVYKWLMSKFTTPDDIFGPVSFEGLKNDVHRRVTAMRLPEASFFFADEIFKSSEAILQSMLMALEERVFINGDVSQKMPLQMAVGASNEYPESESLSALYDRFSVKFWVEPMGDRDSLKDILQNGVADVSYHLEDGDVAEFQDRVKKMRLGGCADILLDVKAAIEKAGFQVSDRKWVKAAALMKAHAVLNGRNRINSSDFSILKDTLWERHSDRAKLSEVIGKASDPFGSKAQAIKDVATSIARELPDMSLLKTKPAHELVGDVMKASSKLKDLKKKVAQFRQDAGDLDIVVEAEEFVENALLECEKRSVEFIRAQS